MRKASQADRALNSDSSNLLSALNRNARVEAAPHAVTTEALQPRAYFATDLHGTNYSRWSFENMDIEHYGFDRSAMNGRESFIVTEPRDAETFSKQDAKSKVE